MTEFDRKLFQALMRTNFPTFLERCLKTLNPGAPFLPNWHLEAIAYQLERVRRGEINRLIINMPPRHLKSLTVTVAYTAFLLGHDPTRRIYTISYGSELTQKHARDARAVLESPWYRQLFPKMKIIRGTDDDVMTSKRGFRKATSVGGAITGMGGDTIIIDDPQKPVDAQSETLRNKTIDWVSNTLMSRLDNKETGSIILVTQRVHMDDLSGFLINERQGWEVLSLPAIAEVDDFIPLGRETLHHRRVGEALHPAHESLEMLLQLQQELGPDVFAAQYQQTPVPAGGNMFKRDWMRYFHPHELPTRSPRSKVHMSIDTAAKDGAQNDWSVITTLQVENGVYYLIDLIRIRAEFPLLQSTVIEAAGRLKPDVVLIEDASTGIALAQQLKAILRRPVELVKVEHDKIGRAYVQQAKFAAGQVRLPHGAAFLPELLREFLTFPQSKHDDQVDAICQALAYQFSTYTLENVRNKPAT